MPELSTLVHAVTADASARPLQAAALDAAPPADAQVRAVARPSVDRSSHHRLMLWLSAIIIAGTFLLEVRPDQRVAVRGFAAFPLPESCGSKILWGIECPGCGLTRSFIWAGRGAWLRSLEVNRVGFLLMLAVVGQIPYRLTMLARRRRNDPTEARWPTWIGLLLIAALFANWALKLLGL